MTDTPRYFVDRYYDRFAIYDVLVLRDGRVGEPYSTAHAARFDCDELNRRYEQRRHSQTPGGKTAAGQPRRDA